MADKMSRRAKGRLRECERRPYRAELHFEDGVWVVEYPELPGCVAHGNTQKEALTAGSEMKTLWLTVALEKGHPIPEPQPEPQYSGRLVLRLPRSLHEKAAYQARREYVSLNTYLIQLIAHGMGRTDA